MRKRLYTIILWVFVCILLTGVSVAEGNDRNGVVVTQSLSGKPVLVGNLPVSFPLVSQPAALNILITGYNGLDQEQVYV